MKLLDSVEEGAESLLLMASALRRGGASLDEGHTAFRDVPPLVDRVVSMYTDEEALTHDAVATGADEVDAALDERYRRHMVAC
jgi:hypothetical protein